MIVFVVWNAARLRGLDPVKAVALVGLNPVIIVFGVGGGHNDLLMLAILLTGLYVLLRQKRADQRSADRDRDRGKAHGRAPAAVRPR